MANLIANQDDFLTVLFKRDMTVSAWHVHMVMEISSADLAMEIDDDDDDDDDVFLWNNDVKNTF